jgi:hypothetical protein
MCTAPAPPTTPLDDWTDRHDAITQTFVRAGASPEVALVLATGRLMREMRQARDEGRRRPVARPRGHVARLRHLAAMRTRSAPTNARRHRRSGRPAPTRFVRPIRKHTGRAPRRSTRTATKPGGRSSDDPPPHRAGHADTRALSGVAV